TALARRAERPQNTRASSAVFVLLSVTSAPLVTLSRTYRLQLIGARNRLVAAAAPALPAPVCTIRLSASVSAPPNAGSSSCSSRYVMVLESGSIVVVSAGALTTNSHTATWSPRLVVPRSMGSLTTDLFAPSGSATVSTSSASRISRVMAHRFLVGVGGGSTRRD